MSEAPASPRANRLATPGWLDTRLVLGVLLVLVSVVVGARVLAGADRSVMVWQAARDLAPGTQLTERDLRPARVRLFDVSGQYLSASSPVEGYVVTRGLLADELVPQQALSRPGEGEDYRLVTVPVEEGHVPPDLASGQQVDVYVSPERVEDAPAAAPGTAPGTAPGPAPGTAPGTAPGEGPPAPPLPTGATLLLEAVTVLRVAEDGGFGSAGADRPVVLRVAPDEVATLVSALSAGRIDLVRVPSPREASRDLVPAGEAG